MKQKIAIVALILTGSSLVLAVPRGKKERGASVYSECGCQHCHKIAGTGGHKGPDLSGVGRRMSKAAMRAQIVHGSKAMPAFGEMLGPDEMNDLIVYLHSCRAKQSKAPGGTSEAARQTEAATAARN